MNYKEWYTHKSFKEEVQNNADDKFYIVKEYSHKKFKIMYFKSKESFLQHILENQSITHCYYNIFYREQRYLYLDIDMYLDYELDNTNIYSLGVEIIRILTTFYNKYKINARNKKRDVSINTPHSMWSHLPTNASG